MNARTPGPWSYDGHGINSVAESHKGERIFKTSLDYTHESVDRERAIADSQLVAAAPEMLDALKLASAALDLWLNGPGDVDGTVTDRALSAVNAAIRKAEGL